MNKEFNCDKDNLESLKPVSDLCELLSTSEVGAAITNSKSICRPIRCGSGNVESIWGGYRYQTSAMVL